MQCSWMGLWPSARCTKRTHSSCTSGPALAGAPGDDTRLPGGDESDIVEASEIADGVVPWGWPARRARPEEAPLEGVSLAGDIARMRLCCLLEESTEGVKVAALWGVLWAAASELGLGKAK